METHTSSNPSNLDIQFNFWQQWYPTAPNNDDYLKPLGEKRPQILDRYYQHHLDLKSLSTSVEPNQAIAKDFGSCLCDRKQWSSDLA